MQARKNENRLKITLKTIYLIVEVLIVIVTATSAVLGRDVSGLTTLHISYLTLAPFIWTNVN